MTKFKMLKQFHEMSTWDVCIIVFSVNDSGVC
uniref:Uncharacterized protein n=1 Tax=Rhizophora mucronata TaxID=61149 RepID=A0A2P2J124_RHIMU